MPPKPKLDESAAELRHRAEKLVTKPAKVFADAEALRLIYELDVYQIELELQNTELRNARDETEALLSKYTELYDFALVGYFTLTADSIIRLVNLTGATMAGIGRSSLIGRSFAMLVAPEQRTEFRIFMKNVFAAENKESGEFELADATQGKRIVCIEARRCPNGLECSTMVLDVTSRTLAQEQMRVSEIRFRRLFETAHDGVLLMDPSTLKITDANPFMTKLLGYPHAELVGKELFEIGLLKDEVASQEMFRKLKKTHQVRYENLPLESQDGQHQEVEVVANLYQENGRSVIQCNIRDITVRKEAQDILRRNESLFSALIGQVPIGVYVVNAEFLLQQANPTALESFGNIDQPIGRDFAEIVRILWPKRVADQTLARFRHTLKTGESYRLPEFIHSRRDLGVKEFYEWRVERIILPAGDYGVVCFFNDITARVRAEHTERNLAVLTASNFKLKQEIIRRKSVEEVLRKTRVEEKRLLQQSRKQELRLRELSHKMILVQEAERKRISRELHDVVAQSLVGINIHVSTLAQETEDQLVSLRERIAVTQEIVDKAVDKVHQFAQELRPTSLDDLGLIPALQTSVRTFMEETGIRVSLKAFAGIEKAPEIVRTAFYRIAQEALINVAKHAGASAVEILIESFEGSISMEISDNGQGFELDKHQVLKKKGRLGLVGMRERAEMIGGDFSVASAPGAPTTVRVVVKSPRPRKPPVKKSKVKRP